MASLIDRYKLELEKKLDEFKSAKDWSDFIGLTDSLISIVKKHKQSFIPCIHQLVKRLNQLLNPVLPGGVHLKTFECYNTIIESVSRENLMKDFDVFTLGLFNFSTKCRIGVASHYIDLIEKLIKHLGFELHPYADHVILGLLPFIDSESSEFYHRSYGILSRFLNDISETRFFKSLWTNFVNYPELRLCIINFFSRYKTVIIPDYGVVNTAFVYGMNSENIYIIRFILEVSSRDFPYTADFTARFGNYLDMRKNTTLIENNIENAESNIRSPTMISLDSIADDFSIVNIEVPVVTSQNSLLISERPGTPNDSVFDLPSENSAQPVKSQLMITDLAMRFFESATEDEKEFLLKKMTFLNNLLLKNVLKIFLKKEVSINKRAYKWLGLDDAITLKDMDYLERGLKLYIKSDVDELCTLFKIMNSLVYKETIIRFLMEKILVDSLKVLKKLEKDKNQENFLHLEKNVRIFINSSLDELFRVFFLHLETLLKNMIIFESSENSIKEYDFVSSDTEDVVFSEQKVYKNEAEEFIDLILYCINDLGAIDTSVCSIHIPLLCNLIIRNKIKLSTFGVDQLISLLELVPKESSCKPEIISFNKIKLFYQKNSLQNEENQLDVNHYNLVGSMAYELCNLNIYKESKADTIFWTSSDLSDQNGILEWTEFKNVFSYKRKMPHFNFKENDIKLIFNFIRRFGFKDFSSEFLSLLGNYLCFNYKYIEMIQILSFYVQKPLLNVNLWNDFVISKNPKFIYFFDEIQVSNFLIEILPTVILEDICIFLKHPIEMGIYVDIFYRVSSIVDTNDSKLMDLVINIQNPIHLLKYLFEKFYENYNFKNNLNDLFPIIKIFRILINNENFIQSIMDQRRIELRAFGEIGILQVLMDLLKILILENYKSMGDDKEEQTCIFSLDEDSKVYNEKNIKQDSLKSDKVESIKSLPDDNKNFYYDENMKSTISGSNVNLKSSQSTVNLNSTCIYNSPIKMQNNISINESDIDKTISNHENNQSVKNFNYISQLRIPTDFEAPKELQNKVIKYDDNFSEINKNLRLSNINPAVKKSTEVLRIGFDILYILNEKGVNMQYLDPKDFFNVIKECKNDYYILSKSLFLFSGYVDFIFDNFMHFYKTILFEISKMNIKNDFLNHLTKANTKCSVEILLEAFEYYEDFKNFQISDFYNKAICLLIQECKKYCIVYKFYNGFYNRISHQSVYDFGNNVINSLNEISVVEENKDYHLYKNKLTKKEMMNLNGNNTEQGPLVLFYTGNLNNILNLYDQLYNKNQGLLFSLIPENFDFLYLFGALPYKVDIFRKGLIKLKNNKHLFKFFRIYCKLLTTDEKRQIIKLDSDLLRSIFSFGVQDNASMLFILELFKDQSFSDLSRLIFTTILGSFESKIDYTIKNNVIFDQEVKILKKISKIDIKDNATIMLLKFRIFELLNSKKYQNEALSIIFTYFKQKPNCKIFIDGYLAYFGRLFFDFGLEMKSKIFNTISTSTNFDSFFLIDTLIYGMDSSFFMSAQSGEQLKIQNLKRISFLILSQPYNKFSTKSDHFVSLINNNLHLSNAIKSELLRLCSILLLKIDHFFIQTLYPILIEDFIGGSNFFELKLLTEMIRFVDLSMWMNSSVFNFKILFIEGHEFNKMLKSKLNLENKIFQVLDFNLDSLPNFLAFITDKSTTWEDIQIYFENVEKYYFYILENSVKKDNERTELTILKGFLDIK